MLFFNTEDIASVQTLEAYPVYRYNSACIWLSHTAPGTRSSHWQCSADVSRGRCTCITYIVILLRTRSTRRKVALRVKRRAGGVKENKKTPMIIILLSGGHNNSDTNDDDDYIRRVLLYMSIRRSREYGLCAVKPIGWVYLNVCLSCKGRTEK